MVTVTLSDGTALTCTTCHRFLIQEGRSVRGLAAHGLRPGTALAKLTMPVIVEGEAVDPKRAYTQGFYSGDGHSCDGKACAWLYGVKQEIALAALAERHGAERSLAVLDVPELDKTFVPFSSSIEARLAWFAGLIDSDGTLTKGGQVHVWSVNRRFLCEVRLLLTTMGGLGEDRGREAGWAVHMAGRADLSKPTVVPITGERVGCRPAAGSWARSILQRVGVDAVAPNRDARRFIRVVSIETTRRAESAYSFTGPLRGLGRFEGIITGY